MPDLTTTTLAELRRLAEAANALHAGSAWLHGPVADDDTETVGQWMAGCSADPTAPAAGRIHVVWTEGSGEERVVIQAIVGDTDTAPIRAAFMANSNPAVVLALLDAAAERDEIAGRLAQLLCDLTGGRLSMTAYPVPVMVQEIEQYLSEWHESYLKDERDALAATVERVRALHRPMPNLVAFTLGGDRVVEDRCAVCGTGYPCSTIRALDGEATP